MTVDELAEKYVKRLEESLLESLKGQMKETIAAIVQVHFDGLNKRFDSFSKTLDAWKTDLDMDRDSLQKLAIGVNNIQTTMTEILKVTNGLPRKMEDKVGQSINESVAQAVPQAVSETFDVTKKGVTVTQKPRKKFLGFI